ncbi:MAG: asparagine synthase (glutamine-hydrolyzing) [Syntrophomonas sp.]|nr:asparagine synthase (glutamine-hydrolyzing) [Syntrophomonas sp.]
MCGIAGWIDLKENIFRQSAVMEAMVRSLIPRGPDAEGIWRSSHAVLGHRRLVVVDPEGGTQPMIRSQNGKNYTITYNGELYNTLEIRRTLENCGYHFQTRNSDTEVLLTAYIEWGADCVTRFNGIFAFAIWDEEKQSLFMARDRLGVKPLFYAKKGNSFLFSSEIKALLAHPQVEAIVDSEGLAEIFVLGPARTPGNGVFKGLYEVRPGHTLTYDYQGIHIHRYWSLESFPHREDLDTTTCHLRELFQDTVKRQLVSDVPICTFLSGGLDSSAITAVAAQVFREEGRPPLKTFSVDYMDNDKYYRSNSFETSADTPWAERVSKYLGTDHNAIFIDNKELSDALGPSMEAHDLPGMTDIDASLYLFCREVRKGAVVALSGECADEILGGYPWFRAEKEIGIDTFPWNRMLAERSDYLSPEMVKKMNPEAYSRERYLEALQEVPRLEGESLAEARMREMFYLNISRFMPTLLDRKDRMSMAWGLEVRVPFSDHRLLEYIWNIPWSMKNHNGMSKGILRRALCGLLPDEVLLRQKSPYPKTHHPIYGQAVRSELKSVLKNPASPLLELIKREELEGILDSGQAFLKMPWFGQLMGDIQFMAYLLQVNRWLVKYKVKISI